METFGHESVMTAEVLTWLKPHAGGVYADATLGGSGHTLAVLEASGPDGKVIAIDRDPSAIEHARVRLAAYADRVQLVHGEFRSLPALLRAAGHPLVHGVIADLGVSSPQLDRAERGFSFVHKGPIDMRMDPSSGETALALIARLSTRELADVLYQLGDERRSHAVARAIHAALAAGELQDTLDLRRAVVKAIGRPPRAKIDPATRTFQALRIAVNAEYEQLSALLSCLSQILEDGGVAVLISFHSLEDRAVKHALRADAALSVLTKRPIVASADEQANNPRSRSAKLRAAQRLPRAGRQVQP